MCVNNNSINKNITYISKSLRCKHFIKETKKLLKVKGANHTAGKPFEVRHNTHHRSTILFVIMYERKIDSKVSRRERIYSGNLLHALCLCREIISTNRITKYQWH